MGNRHVHIISIIIDASNHDEWYNKQPYLPGTPGAGKIGGLTPGINGAPGAWGNPWGMPGVGRIGRRGRGTPPGNASRCWLKGAPAWKAAACPRCSLILWSIKLWVCCSSNCW
jgi:hypothetical protein